LPADPSATPAWFLLRALITNPQAPGVLTFDEAQVIGLRKVTSHTYIGVAAGYAPDCRRRGRADPSANDNAAGITSLEKRDVGGHRYGGTEDQSGPPPSVPQCRDIHHSGGENMRFLQAECLGVNLGGRGMIRGAPSSPFLMPSSTVRFAVNESLLRTGASARTGFAARSWRSLE